MSKASKEKKSDSIYLSNKQTTTKTEFAFHLLLKKSLMNYLEGRGKTALLIKKGGKQTKKQTEIRNADRER